MLVRSDEPQVERLPRDGVFEQRVEAMKALLEKLVLQASPHTWS